MATVAKSETNKNNKQKHVEIYKQKYEEYLERIPIRNFIFEITKCCDYSEIFCINKNETLENLHRNIFFQFQVKPELYVINCNTNEKVYVPHSSEITIREWILRNPQLFQPIYPLPEPVVYRLYYHEGCHDSLCNPSPRYANENDNDVVDFSRKNMYFM